MNVGLKRRMATGVNALLVTIMVVAALIMLVDLSGYYGVRVDLSADGVATLQADTLGALAEADRADGPVQVVAFTHQRRNAEALYRDRRVRDLLREIEHHSHNVVTHWVDLDRDSQLAEFYEVTAYGTVVVLHGDQRVDFRDREIFKRLGRDEPGELPNLDFRGEALVARGVAQVLAGRARKIYVLTGHGELSLGESGPQGLQRFAALMGRQGWDAIPLDLLRDRDEGQLTAVPNDANAVLVVAPRATLDPSEVIALRSYVRGGGSLAVYAEPNRSAPELLDVWDVSLLQGTAIDRPSLAPYDDWFVPRYGSHAIIDELSEAGIKTVFAHGGALRMPSGDGVEVNDLLTTSLSGWVERGQERPPSAFDDRTDVKGPHPVMSAMELSAPSGRVDQRARLIVAGDASMISNELMVRLGNPTLGVNAVRWLVGDDDRMTMVGRRGRLRNMSLSQATRSGIGWLVIGLWPLLAVLAGAIVLSLRRGR